MKNEIETMIYTFIDFQFFFLVKTQKQTHNNFFKVFVQIPGKYSNSWQIHARPPIFEIITEYFLFLYLT